MDTHFASDARKTAEDYFNSGFYCAESAVIALAKAQGIESDLLPRIATGFCAGMARSCGTCGALTGAIMGIGMAFGRSESGTPANQTYLATQRLIRAFEREFGSRDCHVLVGCDLGTPDGQATFRNNQLRVRCAKITGRATEIAAEIIAESNG